jgi:hypothetical protein
MELQAGIEVIDGNLNVKDNDKGDDNEERRGEVLLTYILERSHVSVRVRNPPDEAIIATS